MICGIINVVQIQFMLNLNSFVLKPQVLGNSLSPFDCSYEIDIDVKQDTLKITLNFQLKHSNFNGD